MTIRNKSEYIIIGEVFNGYVNLGGYIVNFDSQKESVYDGHRVNWTGNLNMDKSNLHIDGEYVGFAYGIYRYEA